MLHRILCLLAGYVFGLFQTGYIVGKKMNVDIRTKGSGNAGTTNALRVLGPKAGAVVFVGDWGKSFLLCTLVRLIYQNQMPEATLMLMIYGGMGVILGHNYPFYLQFKGGKGIAATAGIFSALLDWRFFILCILAFAIPVAVTRYVSLGSLIFEVVFVILWFLWGRQLKPVLSEACFMEAAVVLMAAAALAFWRHRANIVRLLAGKENKLNFKKKPEV